MGWATAYAKQAKSDLEARDRLLKFHDLPDCHQLHYLQMASEKLCKAYQMARGQDPELFMKSHAFVAGTLPVIARQTLANEVGRLPHNSWIIRAIRQLARKIELLAPAVDDAGRQPSNCEYPWQGSDGSIVSPAEFKFDFSILYEKAGVTLLKVLRNAVEELINEESSVTRG